jgi:hypothetical protein
VFVVGAHYVFGDLRSWGWITLIIAVLQLFAAGKADGAPPARPGPAPGAKTSSQLPR